jgi:uncharacterized membrane protein
VGALLRTTIGKLVVAAVAALFAAAAVGLVVLWPGDAKQVGLVAGSSAQTYQAEVVDSRPIVCRNPAADGCRRLGIELGSGPRAGHRSFLTVGDAGPAPDLDSGAGLRVVRNEVPAGAEPGAVDPYALVEVDRRSPMLWLVLAFAGLVIVFGRLRGALVLIGLGVSVLIVVEFVIPALLDDKPPVAVALVGSFAVMLVTIALAHGLGPKSLAAMLGTGASLVATVLLALLFTNVAELTGFSSEEATLLQASDPTFSLTGLVLAGMVIGALGVLDDVTVSQASTVMALRSANPTQRARELYRGALSVGRDHVAATVNTLVLAYAGASLPILLVFGIAGTEFADTINREAVAEQVIAMLVGSIGLILAVPVTTALAAGLATQLSLEELPAGATHSQ